MRSIVTNPRPILSALIFLPSAGRPGFYARTFGVAALSALPSYEAIEQAEASDGVFGDRSSRSGFATPDGVAAGECAADLAQAALSASTCLGVPGEGREAAVSAGALMADRLRFPRTGEDLTIPCRLSLTGGPSDGLSDVSGNLWIYDAASHAEVFSLRLDPGIGIVEDEREWTIPASSSGLFDVVLFLSSDAFLDGRDESPRTESFQIRFRWNLPETAAYVSESGVFHPEPLRSPTLLSLR